MVGKDKEEKNMKFLIGEKVYLRGLTIDDCKDNYLQMVNDVSALTFMEGIGYRPIFKNELESYIETNKINSNLLLGIFGNNTDIHVGNVRLIQIKPYHNNYVLGILLHKDYRGKGFGYEAVMLVIKYSFEIINMHRIQFVAVADNIAANKLYQKIGAIKEGELREAFYYNGSYHNMIVYSILKSEYFKKMRC